MERNQKGLPLHKIPEPMGGLAVEARPQGS
jgi:hypothetical protein